VDPCNEGEAARKAASAEGGDPEAIDLAVVRPHP
jgi:hypothetical protein